jgi:DNA-binding NtrC family response regulator
LTAVRATERGAFDYLPKPFDLTNLLTMVKRALALPRTPLIEAVEPARFEEQLPIIGRSQPMQEIYRAIARLMGTDLTIMINGESGTGKELVARAMHDYGKRRGGPFIAVNMAAIPRELIESELFGHEKGSFTANARKVGRFEQAEGGTLFLDEIGDMPLEAQTRLLRVLQSGEFMPVGGRTPIKANLRIIAATHRDLRHLVSQALFREDLFYRLNVIPFLVPPLRERKEDVPLLARYFLKEFSAAYSRRPKELTDDAVDTLARYVWPGNVRELRNVIERVVIMNPTAHRLERKHLPPLVYRNGARRAVGDFSTLHQARAAYERDYILKKLDENHGNISRTAEVLGLERSHLYRKMKALGIAVKE